MLLIAAHLRMLGFGLLVAASCWSFLFPDDDYIQYFWATLEAFDNAQRALFLRFVWARSRLPATKEEFTQKFKIQASTSAGALTNPDKQVVDSPARTVVPAGQCWCW